MCLIYKIDSTGRSESATHTYSMFLVQGYLASFRWSCVSWCAWYWVAMLCPPGSKETKRVDLCHAEGCSSHTSFSTLPDTSYTVASLQDASFHENTLYDRPEEVGHESHLWIDARREQIHFQHDFVSGTRGEGCALVGKASRGGPLKQTHIHTLAFIVEAGVIDVR